jgi:hypothetical protein
LFLTRAGTDVIRRLDRGRCIGNRDQPSERRDPGLKQPKGDLLSFNLDC